eukprot:1157332-Pelagomonas_calceolata.AAC.4
MQTWKPGKHYVGPQPEYEDLFSMLPRYACPVRGPKGAGSGSWRAVTAAGRIIQASRFSFLILFSPAKLTQPHYTRCSDCSVMLSRYFPCKNWCTGSNFLGSCPSPLDPQNMLLINSPSIAAGQASRGVA